MRCQNCGFEMKEPGRFCPSCGKMLTLTCSSCGAELEEDQLFCTQCGARVEKSREVSAPNAVPPAGTGNNTLFYEPNQPKAQAASGYSSYAYTGNQNTAATREGVGVGRRLAAVVIDTVILYLISYYISKSFGTATMNTVGGLDTQFSLSGTPALIAMAIWFLYFVLLEAGMGATVGKLIFGLRVVMVDGSKCSFTASFIRNILRIVDAIPFVIPYLLGAILVATSPLKQRIGDRAAKTMVVRK